MGAGLPAGWTASNVEPVAYHDLDGLPGLKMAVHEKEGRWYLYLGHLPLRGTNQSGWRVMDVTNPANPETLKYYELPKDVASATPDVGGDLMMLGTSYPRNSQPTGNIGAEMWDISVPGEPKYLGIYETTGRGTHRNFFDGSDYMHLSAYMEGYEGAIYIIVDVSEPTRPVEAGRWWFPGQHKAAGETYAEESDGVGQGLHGPPYVVGDRAYLSYSKAGMIILDISDISKPKQISRLDYSPPLTAWLPVHSVLPLADEKSVLVVPETVTNRCEGESVLPPSIVDISNLNKPLILSFFPRPVPPDDAPYADFCDAGGRFGPHNINQHQHSPDVLKIGNLVHMTYFNAGLRLYDISHLRQPKEVGFFIPPPPEKNRFSPPDQTKIAQTTEIVVDARGYIYLTDHDQGLWIVKRTE